MLNFDDLIGEEYFELLLASRVSYLRVINTSPDVNVNIYVNGVLFASNVRYLSYSRYRPVAPGRYDIAVFPAAGALRPLKTQTVVIQPRTFVTFAVYGLRAQINARTLIDSSMGAPRGRSSFKMAHFAPTAPAVDLFANTRKIFDDVKYGEVTKYEDVAAGSYSFQLKKYDTNQVLYTLPSQRLVADNTYTAFVTGLPSGAPALRMTFILDGRSALREQNRLRDQTRPRSTD